MKHLKKYNENFPGSATPDQYQKRTGDMSGEYKHMHTLGEPTHDKAISHIKSLEDSIVFLQKVYESIVATGVADDLQVKFIDDLHDLCTDDYFESN